MDLHDFLRVLRKRWRVLVLTTVLVVTAAAAYTALSPNVYAASTQFFVSTSGTDNAASLQQGNSFTQQRVKSYAQLLETPQVLDAVIKERGLTESAAVLARSVSTTIPLDTVMIQVTVTDNDRQRAIDIARSIGQVFPTEVSELERVKAGEDSPVKVTVVKPASAEAAPISPRPVRNLAAGLLLGLLAGFGLAQLRDVLDTRIKGVRDLADVTNLAVIGGIPFDDDASARPLIVQGDRRSIRAEAFRSLRTNLQFLDVENPPRSIVITSSVPREGKSTTAANLALCLAETGRSVVVVEGDLRRPRLLDYLGYEGSVGLTDVLIGRAELDEVLQPFGDTTLSLLGAGLIPPNPSELVGSSNMRAIVEQLEERFDMVLIDAPPLLPVTDAAVLSTHVDGAVLVVGADVVSREQVRQALGLLQSVNASVLGIILNRVKAVDGGSYGTYRYTYEPESNREVAKRQVAKRQRRDGSEGEATTPLTGPIEVTDAVK